MFSEVDEKKTMLKGKKNEILVFGVDEQRYALLLSVVARVIRIVDVTPLPHAPDFLLGLINMHGEVLPVLSMRKLLGVPEKEAALSDQLILSQTLGLKVAILADNVIGTAECKEEDVISPAKIFPGIGSIAGVVKLSDGLVLIYDFDKFLSAKEKAIRECLSQVASAASEGGATGNDAAGDSGND